ncbi:unknown [Antheraea pernyi nucleopolyhedrovirus]|uniref:Uncharacterized protein n=2 Tax=Antheraea pernyi nuclear polyhedrosis virus TaxID=161494 RepID=Q1HGX1_NPVAP|nr:hypothetical protein APNV_p129 [Antheraea pernyi nucleopolyhedrovirus]BBD50590.1 hypothetical protein [Antheraea yamamai nucleopolyhedrovirus]BBD50742.1 hypothetical protein [Samia cynthia nucleopolyhedrovirus]BBD50895.1 hypothetical protein [Antheraea proylei nucleopolyhedrovirus]ABF50359.1 unknown [Antheraea pernyi nucleopolyhedrovirus]ABQ12359.1 unknown [Antheraea pernyi nucleopolyhedrovirus]
MQFNASNTRPDRATARAQQTLGSHGLFYQHAIAFATAALTGDRLSWPALLSAFDTIVALERSVFNRSLVLNGLINFCIANGDGVTVQHQLLNQMLGVLLDKYY